MHVTKSRAFWPYQIRRLLDSGSWTVEEIAAALKKTPERIRQYVSGRAIPEPVAQRNLLRMFTTYEKRCVKEGREPHPRPSTSPHQPPAAERGVYVEEISPPGETWYKVVLTNGKVGLVHFPNELVDTALYDNLCRRLDAKDKVNELRVI